jgi:ABC-type transporter Mla subunit MlaD
MRRLAAIAVLLGAAGALAAFAFGSTAQGSSTASFDVIFDDARGLIGGQLVKVAGAQAGTIDNVTVTSNFKARIEASIDSRFMPFRANATCTIRPEGLIAENYIDCDPGSPPAPILKSQNGLPPTVPVQNTSEPVSLLDLFNIFNLPTRERFAVILNELGIGTAGEGQNFNDILRRANPALALARQVIGILDRQRNQVATLVDATNTIAKDGANHTGEIQNFLTRAASLSQLTAAHADPLSQAINRLPGLLAAAQPSLQDLDTVAVDGTPLVRQIHAAVPSLNKVTTDLGPFVKVAKPGLADLGVALKRAIPAIRDTTPLTKTLRNYSDRSLSGTLLVGRLFKNLQQHGFTENFLSVVYYNAAALARFDDTSHLLSVLLLAPGNGACGNYATKPVAGCSAHYYSGTGQKYKPSPQLARQSRGDRSAGKPAAAKGAGASTASTAGSSAATAPSAGAGVGSAAALIERLLAGTNQATKSAISRLEGALGGSQAPSSQSLQNLVNYLVK